MLDLIKSNKRRSVALIAGFVVVLVLVGAAVGLLLGYGAQGTIIALVIAGVMAFGSYWKSDAIALAVSRARPADPQQYQRLHNLVEGLCIASGLPKPRVYVVDDPAPNAFATGRDPKHAAIAVTTGYLLDGPFQTLVSRSSVFKPDLDLHGGPDSKIDPDRKSVV